MKFCVGECEGIPFNINYIIKFSTFQQQLPRNPKNILIYSQNGDIIIMPNKTEYISNAVFSLNGITIPFFLHNHFMEFGKSVSSTK